MDEERIFKAYVRKTGKQVRVHKAKDSCYYIDEESNPYREHELDFNVRNENNNKGVSKPEVEELPGLKEMFNTFMGMERVRNDREEWLRKRIILIQTYIERGDDDLDAIFAKVDRIIEYLKLKE